MGSRVKLNGGLVIRILAILYLPYIMFKLVELHRAGEAGVSEAVYICVMAVMAAAEIAIAVSIVLNIRKQLKEQKDKE